MIPVWGCCIEVFCSTFPKIEKTDDIITGIGSSTPKTLCGGEHRQRFTTAVETVKEERGHHAGCLREEPPHH